MRIRFGVVFVALLVVTSHANAQANFRFYEPVEPPRKIQVVVERGMAIAAPENSASAIEMCIRDYCEWARIDVRLTKDGHHVVIHDETVDRTTDGKGRVADLTLEELKKLDAGASFAKRFTGTRILTLPEVLALAKGKINLQLNCNAIEPKRLCDEITASGMERQVIVSAAPETLARVREASGGMVACIAKYDPKSKPIEQFVKDVAPAAAEIGAEEATPDLCRQLHSAGVKVQISLPGEKWDNAKLREQAFASGVDWIVTDDPASVLYFNFHRAYGNLPVKVSAHRGTNRYAPENTVASIRGAARTGVDFAEIDIRTTRDGKLVLLHDSTLNRTTPGKGPVRQVTFAEATALSAGTWFGKPFRDTHVPSFDDGLTALGDTCGVYLDSKDIAPDALLAAIHKYHLEDRHVVYQSASYCDNLHKLDSTVRTLPPLRKLDQLDSVAAVKPYGVDAEWTILSKEMIAKCHERGIKVFSDALGKNEKIEEYQKAMDWGIDCIQTDYPLRVLRAVELRKAHSSK
jgi:glycerophosphoryl diester phosphodiesterase